MKDLGAAKYCLRLKIEQLPGGILLHQTSYTKKVLERFYLKKSHPLGTPIIVRSFEVEKDPYGLKHENEVLGLEIPYLSSIGSLLYLANFTRPNIVFSVSCFARYL